MGSEAAVALIPRSESTLWVDQAGSAATMWLHKVPMPSMVVSITSPGWRNSGGVRAKPTPAGVPVAMMSPGSSVRGRPLGDDRRDIEKHVRRRVFLLDGAIHREAQGERLRIGNLIRRHDDWSHWTGAVQALAEEPLDAGTILDVARAEVVDDGVAEDV